jgi:hypothetical protein
MLPLIAPHRLDCALGPSKQEVLKQVEKVESQEAFAEAIEKALAKVASKERKRRSLKPANTLSEAVGRAVG